jgi:nicotinic acid mononucleotide adenylyltransferase
VIISPAPAAPLRSDERLFSYRERFSLLRFCFAKELAERSVVLSVLERTLPKPNFTIQTLAALVSLCGTKPVVVIGADQAAQIGRWHRAQELMREYEFIVFARAAAPTTLDARLRHRFIADFDFPISATSMRSRLKMLPPKERFAEARRLANEIE